MLPVSSLDAGMLYAETPEMPMHTIGVVVIEPPSEPAFAAMRRMFEERLHLMAPLRRRLVEGPLELGDPHWIEDPDFDLDNHLRRAAVPSPGSTRELAEFVGDLASRPLERSKPLWEIVLVEGLEGGNLAVVSKVHHAAMDGGRVVALLLGCVFDSTPEGKSVAPPEEAWTPDREPSLAWLAADAARSLAAKPLHAIRAIADVAATTLEGARAQRDRDAGVAKLFEAPPTPFNGALTRHRSVALADVAFDDLKLIKRAFGTTINDVVLAASCGALRSWLPAHGGLPEQPLVANVPITVRSEGEEDDGNRVSMILVHLPLQTEDPAERLMAIHAETKRAKDAHGHGRGDVFQQLTALLTNITVPWLLTHVVELYSSANVADRVPPLWNLVVSNLPGPPALYFAGAKVLGVYPLGPVQQGSGLSLTVLSAVGRLCLGVMACKEMLPDVEDIGAGFAAEIEVLKGLAEGRR